MEHDYIEWPAERLVERYNALGESLTIPHNEERITALKRELAEVAFEIHCRIHIDESIQLEVVEGEPEDAISLDELMQT